MASRHPLPLSLSPLCLTDRITTPEKP